MARQGPPGSEGAAELIAADNEAHRLFGAHALAPQFRLLLLLLLRGDGLPVKQAFLETPLSNRSFFLLVAALKERKLVSVAPDVRDRRVRLLRLTQAARTRLAVVLDSAGRQG